MIHIATVHWETGKWIDIQLKYLRENINQPYRIYAFLSGEASAYRDQFYYASVEPIKDHATKLNILSDIIRFASTDPADPLIFIDGDAFPVQPLDAFIADTLAGYPLAAIQRVENYDIQPHPSFCLTSIGFWYGIKGDWKEGFHWQSTQGLLRTDVGGNLLKLLNDNRTEWLPLHRTNTNAIHQVMFGVYSNLVYHHGAGFRYPMSRYDRLKSTGHILKTSWAAKLLDWFFSLLSLKNRFRAHKLLGISKRIMAQNAALSTKVYSEIRNDVSFYKSL